MHLATANSIIYDVAPFSNQESLASDLSPFPKLHISETGPPTTLSPLTWPLVGFIAHGDMMP